MKKILLLAMLLVFSFAVHAQKDVTKFLGIPIDGTKSEMIKKLKEKGFTESVLGDDVLEGEFNGVDVYIYIGTNNNKVWRIAVADAYPRDETNIRIRFNKLCSQFERNKKYFEANINSSAYIDYTIPDDEDISYEMKVNKKRYEALYTQLPDSAFVAQQLLSRYEKSRWDSIPPKLQESLFNLEKSAQTVIASINKSGWFTISEHPLGEYFIIMYYDNEYNRAQGEDL